MSNGTQTALTPNQKVSNFALGRLGQKVGTGDCWDLADAALRNASARSSGDYGANTANADYVWGQTVQLNAVQEGDILQFRNHKITIETIVTTKKTAPDGGWNEDEKWEKNTYQRPHHTAIISVNKGSGVLEIFEQNVRPGGKKVQKHTIYTTSMTMKPEKLPPRMEGRTRVEVTKVTTIKVEGQIWAYRPQPN